ncbi:hypothetical protein J2S64_000051 [Paeniglutamicibacter sulfureus]|uniref:Uncharacterized protein n=1 Tax=Paeniglutamicibacter sulfureus TaxID=43666 RepID=A0ABU2BCJ3_9MICC|nr:hypothetical protein [Paeniglutamicibacter sulfureus]
MDSWVYWVLLLPQGERINSPTYRRSANGSRYQAPDRHIFPSTPSRFMRDNYGPCLR